jgi:hypothetical protein
MNILQERKRIMGIRFRFPVMESIVLLVNEAGRSPLKYS